MLTQPVLLSVCTDADASKAFYRDVLGFTLVEDSPYAVVFDAHGTSLRIQKLQPGQPFSPLPCTLLGWAVDDIEATVDALTAKGVSFLRYPHFEQDARGIWSAPAAKVCWFCDPAKNILSLTQED